MILLYTLFRLRSEDLITDVKDLRIYRHKNFRTEAPACGSRLGFQRLRTGIQKSSIRLQKLRMPAWYFVMREPARSTKTSIFMKAKPPKMDPDKFFLTTQPATDILYFSPPKKHGKRAQQYRGVRKFDLRGENCSQSGWKPVKKHIKEQPCRRKHRRNQVVGEAMHSKQALHEHRRGRDSSLLSGSDWGACTNLE